MPLNYPKISCLTVTKDRLLALKTAIRCFCGQVYPEKEMVIISDGSRWYNDAIQRYVVELGRKDIRLVIINETCTLGKLRNLSIAEATGEIICQWDDDDLYHPERLSMQYAKMSADNAKACCMTDQLHYFYEERELFWCDWKANEKLPLLQLIPGTIMMYKDKRFAYPETGDFASSGEDSIFLGSIFETFPVAELSGMGYLYAYTFSGNNTFSEKHHRIISEKYSVSSDKVWEIETKLQAALDYYQLPSPIRIMSHEQQIVFTWMFNYQSVL
ncbi:MAG: glycosyl transferase family 2 [Bacteroidetes bacterium]|jgi:glycosyltransferase involved in cell wall biosynthesis|nr:glycosyl transferase family 2 [Bacteroidota bacterium]